MVCSTDSPSPGRKLSEVCARRPWVVQSPGTSSRPRWCDSKECRAVHLAPRAAGRMARLTSDRLQELPGEGGGDGKVDIRPPAGAAGGMARLTLDPLQELPGDGKVDVRAPAGAAGRMARLTSDRLRELPGEWQG